MNRILLGLPTLGVALALGFAPGAGAARYVSTQALSPPDRVSVDPNVLVLPSGERIVAWTQNLSDGFSGDNVSVRSAPAGGDFGATQTFPGIGNFAGLQAAAGADGTVALAWTNSVTNTVHIARRAPGETSFTEATPLKATNEGSFGVHLAMSGGDAYVAFQSFTQSATHPSSVWVARLAANDGAVRVVPGPALGGAVDHAQFNNGDPEVFVESIDLAIEAGHPVVTWQRQTFGAGNQLGSTRLGLSKGGDDGTMSTPVTVIGISSGSATPRSVVPTIASGGGHTYVLWDNGSQQLVFRDVAAGGTVTIIPADTRFRGGLRAAADGSGALIAAWEGAPEGINASLIEAVVAPPGAAPPQAVRLTAPGPGRKLDDLAVADDGSALAIFDHESSGFDTSEQIDGSLRVGGGPFGPVESISGLQDVPRSTVHDAAAAVAPGGGALAVWSSSDGAGSQNQRLHLSERDVTPPTLDAVNVPASAVVGLPVALSASASDALSGTAVSWDFGDGSEADGASVSHTFGTPGAATVTVKATDGAGNSTQQTRVVAVSAAPGPVADQIAPSVTRLILSPKRFRAGGKGTALRLDLSERATLVVTVKRGNVVRGTLVRANTRAGAVSVRIGARFGGAKLRPGLYTATVSAIDGAGNRSKARSAKFRVVKP
jgi:hypothetical protein